MVDLQSIGAGAFLLRRKGDGEFVYADVNPALERITGLSREALVGKTSSEAFGLDVGGKVQAHQQRCASQRTQVEYETPMRVPRGAQYFQTTLTPLLRGEDAVDEILAITVDISDRKRLESELMAANLRLNLALDALGGANWTFDKETGWFDLSPSFDLILGAAVPRKMSLDEWQSHVLEEDRNDTCFADLMSGKIEQGTAEFRVKASNGETRWLRCKRRAVSDGLSVTGITGVVVDISSEKRQQAELSLQASSDALTGLANRRSFDRELAMVRSDPDLAVLMIDVDDFKAYNDTYGHIAGDAVLRSVAALLGIIASDNGGCAARYGGEEFSLLLPGASLEQASACAERVIDELHTLALPHAGSSRGLVSVSIGVAAGLSFGAVEAADLVVAADRALYRAKAAGRACYRISDADGSETTQPSLRVGHARSCAAAGVLVKTRASAPVLV